MDSLLLRYPLRQDWYFGSADPTEVVHWVFPELGDDADPSAAAVRTAQACQAAEGRDFERVRRQSRYLRMTVEDIQLYGAPKGEHFGGILPKSWIRKAPLYLTAPQLGPGRLPPAGSVEVVGLSPAVQLRHLIDAGVLEDLVPGAFRA